MDIDPDLRDRLQKLAETLQRIVAESPEVGRALLDLRTDGLHPTLVLELTVSLSTSSEDGATEQDEFELEAFELPNPGSEALARLLEADESDADELEADDPEETSGPRSEGALPTLGERMAPEDRDFLRSLHIRLD